MEDRKVAGALTDIGTEELGHLEIVATIIHQLTKDLTPEEIKASGFDKYYIDHTLAIWPQAASGEPFSASQFQSTGDTITDLYENMAAEQKARLTTITFCALSRILKLLIRSVSCECVRLYISSVSGNVCAAFRIREILRTSTHTIHRLIRRNVSVNE